MKKKPLIIIGAAVGIIAVIAAVAIIAFSLGAGKAPEVAVTEERPSVAAGRGTVATEENVDELREQMEQPIEDAYYTAVMTVDWEFADSKSESTTARVRNSELNTRTVYFDLTLADTGELLYSSPYIPVGESLENIKLDADLPAGEYAGVVTYHLVDDDFAEITTTSLGVTLHIGG